MRPCAENGASLASGRSHSDTVAAGGKLPVLQSTAVLDALGQQLLQAAFVPGDDLDDVPELLGVLVQRRNVVVELLAQRHVDPQVVAEAVDRHARLEETGN